MSGIDASVSATVLESSTTTLFVSGIASSKMAMQKIKAKTECANAFTTRVLVAPSLSKYMVGATLKQSSFFG
jgi:hypothetical protein